MRAGGDGKPRTEERERRNALAAILSRLDCRPVKGNSLLVGLAFLFAALSVGVTLFAYEYVQLTRALNRAQITVNQVEVRQNRLKALVAEAMDYSQRNPAINPLLYAIGAKQPPNAPAGAAPATPLPR